MTYKLAMKLRDAYRNKEAFDIDLQTRALELQAIKTQLNQLRAAAPAGTARGIAGAAVAKFEAAAKAGRTELISKLERDYPLVKAKVLKLAGEARITDLVIDDTTGTVYRSGGKWATEGFNTMCRYDYTDTMKSSTRLSIRGGVFYNSKGEKVDTTKASSALGTGATGVKMYAMSGKGVFHMDEADVGLRHHSSLLAGGDVACAGEMSIKEGKLLWVSNSSGHYMPRLVNLLQVLHELTRRDRHGINYTFQIKCYDGNNLTQVDDATFMRLLQREVNTDLNLNAQPPALADREEAYHYYNLLYAYGHILADTTWMQAQGLRWNPTGTPPGVYEIGGGHVSSRAARTRLSNAKIPGREAARSRGEKPKGAGTAPNPFLTPAMAGD